MTASVPFADPPWQTGAPSPYYNDSHRRFQKACREFITEHLTKHALEWETAEEVPSHVYGQFAAANFIIPSLPSPLPVEWLRRVGITHMPGDVPVEEWDSIHGMIYGDEVSNLDICCFIT
jgi:acyl-CoA dehydrogenase